MTREYSVTGTLSPDSTGKYPYYGTVNGKDSWTREDGNFHMFWTDVESCYAISAIRGDHSAPSWWGGAEHEGAYTAQAPATGEATVSFP